MLHIYNNLVMGATVSVCVCVCVCVCLKVRETYNLESQRRTSNMREATEQEACDYRINKGHI
jgi:hypothetical protein